MATRTPRLALLVCDIPIPAVKKDHGEYPMIFDRVFRASLPDRFADFALDPYDVRYAKEYPQVADLDSYDGIVITGSGDALLSVQFSQDKSHFALSIV
jgi:hypothetical protein